VILVAGIILIPILLIIIISSFIASIPSRIGERIAVENWIYRWLDRILDLDLMRDFRDDIYQRIRPHVEFTEDLDRWWVLREMEQSKQRNDRALQSGEYTIAFMFAVGSIVLDNSLYGIPMSLILSVLAIGFSGMVLVRVVTIRVLAFDPDTHQEESTHELGVRMAFNKGPLSRGSSVGLAILTLLIGIVGNRGYGYGLDLIEWYAERSYSDDKDRWCVDSNQ
jgi:hypothetical protein